MRNATIIILLLSLIFAPSCYVRKKHPPIIFTGGEGRLDWICDDYVEQPQKFAVFQDSLCRFISWSGQNGRVDSTISFTKTGRVAERSQFAFDPVDSVSVGETFDSTRLLLFRTITYFNGAGLEKRITRINTSVYKDSVWFEGTKFHNETVAVKKSPDTTETAFTWRYAGKILPVGANESEETMLLNQNWGHTGCAIYSFHDTLLVAGSKITPVGLYEIPPDSMCVKFGNGITSDVISFIDEQGYEQQRFTVHHNIKGRIIAITCENCPSSGNLCPPITDFFFYDKSGRLIEKREAYNWNSTHCPRTARTEATWEYGQSGKLIRFCCYRWPGI